MTLGIANKEVCAFVDMPVAFGAAIKKVGMQPGDIWWEGAVQLIGDRIVTQEPRIF